MQNTYRSIIILLQLDSLFRSKNKTQSDATFAVFLVLTRGAMRVASHLHVAVDVRIRRNFRVEAHLLSTLRRGDLGRRAVLAVVVRAEQAVDFELAFGRNVPQISVQGSRSDSRTQPSAVLRVFQGLKHRVPRCVREPLAGDGAVQTPFHQYHLFSYPLHHQNALRRRGRRRRKDGVEDGRGAE